MSALVRWLLPVIAATGLGYAIAVALRTDRVPPPSTPVAEPASAPFETYVAGSGLVEAMGRNTEIATPVSGVVEAVMVKPGDTVAAGDVLFALEMRDLLSEREVRQAQIRSALAKVTEQEASLDDYRAQLRLAESVTDRRAVSGEDLVKRRGNVRLAEAKLETALADADTARRQLAETETALSRRNVKAPRSGRILQRNVEPGQFATAAALSSPLILMGSADRLAVRVDIDENDAWRFKPGEPARAFLRGNKALFADLTFEYVEPFVRPKQSLSGSSTERVDTRVLQVIYSFSADAVPVYIGQQVDVFMRSPGPHATPFPSSTAPIGQPLTLAEPSLAPKVR